MSVPVGQYVLSVQIRTWAHAHIFIGKLFQGHTGARLGPGCQKKALEIAHVTRDRKGIITFQRPIGRPGNMAVTPVRRQLQRRTISTRDSGGDGLARVYR